LAVQESGLIYKFLCGEGVNRFSFNGDDSTEDVTGLMRWEYEQEG
jgi:hypothetical protein